MRMPLLLGERRDGSGEHLPKSSNVVAGRSRSLQWRKYQRNSFIATRGTAGCELSHLFDHSLYAVLTESKSQ